MSRYIDADKLLAEVNRYRKELVGEYSIYDQYVQGYINCAEKIESAPTADVKEAVRGEWEWFEEWNYNGEIRECDCAGYRCSICKEEPSEYHFFDNPDYPPEFDFCPHCGADLRGNKND